MRHRGALGDRFSLTFGVVLALTVAVACAPAAPSTNLGTPSVSGQASPSGAAPVTPAAVANATTVTAPSVQAAAQTAPVVFTANARGNSVTLIDPVTRRVIETIDVGFPARAVAVTPDGRLAFIVTTPNATTGGGRTSSSATGANAITTPSTGTSATSSRQTTPTGQVVVFDLLTKSRVTQIPVGRDPSAIAMSSDGLMAFVANAGSNDVSVVDVARRAMVATVGVGIRPTDVWVFPPAKPGTTTGATTATGANTVTVYVVDSGSNAVSVLRFGGSTGTSGATAASGSASGTPTGAITPAGTPVATFNVAATIPVGTDPIAIIGMPNGAQVFVANRGSGDVSVIDAATLREAKRISLGQAGATGTTSGTPSSATAAQPAATGVPSPAAMAATAAQVAARIVEPSRDQQTWGFRPESLAANVGDRITWTNTGVATHTVTADTGAFASGNIAPGATFSFTPNTAGTFSYHCSIHPWMKGKLVVHAAAQQTGAATTPSPATTGAPAATTPVAGAPAAVTNAPRPTGLAVSPTGSALFVTMDRPTSQVADVDLRTGTVTRLIPVGPGARDVTFSADGRLAFVVDQQANDLTVIDVPSGNVVQTVPVGQGPVSDTLANAQLAAQPGATSGTPPANATPAPTAAPNAPASPPAMASPPAAAPSGGGGTTGGATGGTSGGTSGGTGGGTSPGGGY